MKYSDEDLARMQREENETIAAGMGRLRRHLDATEGVARTTEQKIRELADLILEQSKERLARLYSDEQASWEKVEIKPGKKYVKIDRGPGSNMSGMLMIEPDTGEIYGIKGYGVIHRGHHYGNLDTIDEWYWGDYYPRQRAS